MHNPFAIAVQWPDESRRYLVHLQRPYFTAAIFETSSALWLRVSWSPNCQNDSAGPESVFRFAAEFCRSELALRNLPIEFVERQHGYHLPRFLMAQSTANGLFIVEPEHPAPLVEVRESARAQDYKRPNPTHRFDVITEWRLGQMRKYYQEFLQRQAEPTAITAPPSGACLAQKK